MAALPRVVRGMEFPGLAPLPARGEGAAVDIIAAEKERLAQGLMPPRFWCSPPPVVSELSLKAERVTILNPSGSAVDLSGWSISDATGRNELLLPEGTLLPKLSEVIPPIAPPFPLSYLLVEPIRGAEGRASPPRNGFAW